jgi:signal transduction histidine kinase
MKFPSPSGSGPPVHHDEALEEQVLSVQRELEHTQRLATIGTVAAGIAHEVNNLLTPALAYAQLARNQSDPELLEKALKSAEEGIRAASEVLHSILDFASPTDRSGDDDCDIADVVEATFSCLGRDPSKDGIEIKRRVPPGLRARIQPLALQQVLLNLILNAMRELKTKKSSGRIRIEAEVAASGGVELSVADNGPGIPDEIAGSIFKPFVSGQGALPSSERQGGSGLGLSICRRLIESCGGQIWVEQTAGGGATFRMSLQAPAAARLARAG